MMNSPQRDKQETDPMWPVRIASERWEGEIGEKGIWGKDSGDVILGLSSVSVSLLLLLVLVVVVVVGVDGNDNRVDRVGFEGKGII